MEIQNPTLKTDYYAQSNEKKPEIKNDFPKILIAAEVAELLEVSIQRVYELTRQRKSNGFPVIVLGKDNTDTVEKLF